jgi:hypothetical protein
MDLDPYGREARALLRAQEDAHAQSLAHFAAQARPLLSADLAQRRQALAHLADPIDPTLGPLGSLLDAVEAPQGPSRLRKLLAWCLDPARGHALAHKLWDALLQTLDPGLALKAEHLRGLRVSPDAAGEPWGSLDLFAWSDSGEGFCACFVLAWEERELKELIPRLPHHTARIARRFGPRAAQGMRAVVVSPKGRLPEEVRAAGWRPLAWVSLWDALRASAEDEALSWGERLWAAQVAREVERAVLRDATLLARASEVAEGAGGLPQHALVCQLQAGLAAGVR